MTVAFRVGVIVFLLVGLLSWLLVRSFAPRDPTLAVMGSALDALALNESYLHTDVLSARAGLLQNYDPIVRDLENMRHAAEDLRPINPEAQGAIATIQESIADQERLVEAFKSSNALLQNSLTYFDLLSDMATRPESDPRVKATVGSLVSAVAHLSQDPSPEIARLVQDRIEALPTEQVASDMPAEIGSLALRGRLLLDLLPRIDGTLRDLRGTTSEAGREAMQSAMRMKGIRDERQAARFRFGLFGIALSLVALLVVAGLWRRADANAMRRRAQFEQLISQASNQFIVCPPEEIPTRIDDVLRVFGEGTDPDRAYVLRFDKPRLHLWSKPGVSPPPGWPGVLKEAVSLLGPVPGESFRTPEQADELPDRLRGVLKDAGIVSWSCVKLMRGTRMIGVLCFDRASARPAWLKGTTGLLRMQGAVIGNALHREFMVQERQGLEARLRQSQRLEAIGTFTSGVAHNFNNVIGTVLGHAEMAADAVPAGSVAGRHVTQIAEAGERAREIVSQILDFGRRGRATQFTTSPDKILAETLRQLEPVLPPCTLVGRGTADGALVLAEPAQLQQVLVNLVRNAEQASAPGARIVIDLDRLRIDEPRVLSHGVLEPGSFVRLTVGDQGWGMDATTASRLFEPFFTTRSAGTGLGLATAHEIVTESGGAFDVHSVLGQGSTFEVWLPEAPVGRPEIAVENGRGGTILLVGADQGDVSGDEELLAALGYEPVGFAEPAAALEALRRHPDRFDLVIADKRLAGMSGFDFARATHDVKPWMPILLCLASTDLVRAEQLTAAGITDVVRRPWRSAVLAATLDRILNVMLVSSEASSV